MIFAKHLSARHHIRSFIVGEADERGWEVREQEDDRVIRTMWTHNWYGVEKAMMRFAIEAVRLRSDGWEEVQAPASSVV